MKVRETLKIELDALMQDLIGKIDTDKPELTVNEVFDLAENVRHLTKIHMFTQMTQKHSMICLYIVWAYATYGLIIKKTNPMPKLLKLIGVLLSL